MSLKVKYLLTFIVWSIAYASYAQFYFLENAQDKLEIDFLKKKIETVSNKTFFNGLSVKNPTSQKLTFYVKFSYPAGWSFMGEKNQQYTLEPHDSLLIPFRASASLDAKGEIGYSIVASLTDQKGNTFKTIYSFVDIPKVQDVKFKPLTRTIYIDQQKKDSEIRLSFSNNGNTDEIFYLDYNLGDDMTAIGARNGILRDEFMLKSYHDTVISLPIYSETSYYSDVQKFHRLQIGVSTGDTAMHATLWARELLGQYYNEIPSTYTMLCVELIGRDLIGGAEPSFGANIYGNLLLKRGGDFHLRAMMSKLDFDDMNQTWKSGRFELKYNNKHGTFAWLGDIQQVMALDLYGRGGLLQQSFGDYSVKLMAETSVYSDKDNFAASFSRKSNAFSFELGGALSDDKDNDRQDIGAFFSSNIQMRRFGNLNMTLSATSSEWKNSTRLGVQSGIGIEATYSNTIKNTHLYGMLHYGQPEYAGRYNGRLELNSQIRQDLSDFNYIVASYARNANNQIRYVGDSIAPSVEVDYDELRVVFSRNLTKSLMYSLGAITESRFGDNFSSRYANTEFATRNILAYGGVRAKGAKRDLISFTLKTGANFATRYDARFDTLNVNKNWFSLLATASYRSGIWGVFFNYYHGPNSLQQQFTHFTRNGYNRVIRANPYLDFYLMPKYVRFVNRSTVSYDITEKTTRINLGSDLVIYPGKTWEFTLTHTWNFSSTYDVITEDRYKYQGSYVEARLRKDFNINQPRYQYYDLDITFYKDLNGNDVRDEDEPGVKDVLFSITIDETQGFNEDAASSFMPIDLMSDMDGRVVYNNVPNGFYTIEYVPMGAIEGAYTTETSKQTVYIGKNMKLDIPFRENNKLFGQIVMNRSKLSNLGSISVANVKVSAEDSKGKIYSTLTDQNGKYTLYVPTVDKYNVKINNIFFENFELEQNNYEVQLNGYRQFEINFVFNEKRRKVNFAQTQEYGLNESDNAIEIIRRANLSGVIKDASTLSPIAASVVVLNGDGKVVAKDESNLKTGMYNMSFLAGDNYSIEVSAPGYWFYAEKLYEKQEITFSSNEKDIMLKQITEGAIIPMENLTFEPGSSEISPIAFPELERLLRVLKQNPSVKIAVYGHADDTEVGGGRDIAQDRARIIASYLIANGYNRVKYMGFSNTRPVAANDSEEGRAQNRRCEIVVVEK